mgnify:CR=1 FL=1
MKNKVIFIIVSFFFIGCASKTTGPYGPNYYYGGYLYNLDNYKKNLTPESEEQLINALHNIISKSKEYDADRNTEIKDWRVPPGICAELFRIVQTLFCLSGWNLPKTEERSL